MRTFSRVRPGSGFRHTIPAVAGWDSYPGAVASLLALGLAVVGLTWLVHQTEYLIEYGQGFGATMAAGPHRLYMSEAGFMIGAVVGVLTTSAALWAGVTQFRLRVISQRLPARFASRLRGAEWRIPFRCIATTAVLLALGQIALYTVQENIESFTVLGSWPALTVLFAPQHVTVVPLHLVGACFGSALLWLVATLLRRSHRRLQLGRALLSLSTPVGAVLRRPFFPRVYSPSLRLDTVAAGPRSPPLSA